MDQELARIKTAATAAEEKTYRRLAEICRENEGMWSNEGSPCLETYPFGLVCFDTVEDLRRFFAYGSWAAGQGAIFGDLAFIKLSDTDEWWTLKQKGNDWIPFESVSFEALASYLQRGKFINLIRSMRKASVAQCENLTYMLSEEKKESSHGK